MRSLIHTLPILAGIFICTSCKEKVVEKSINEIPAALIKDPHTHANSSEAVVRHLDWKAIIDMGAKQIIATASWTIENKNKAKTIHFDSRGLQIERVYLDADSIGVSFELKSEDPILGSDLVIPIQTNTKKVHIQYKTKGNNAALQWLNPEQTAGQTLPFLFTQSQAILARTWIPCQDSPGIRFTYSADVQVPSSYLALMSASNPTEKSADGRYHFEQTKPIPAYLMALAVGDIKFKALSDRSGVYAEAATLDKAASEFSDIDKMLKSAEKLYGNYVWKRYDVLVLPPSFPFGGMENPELTFATPTILAGDKSLVSLIAHELAHSWSGNLVTNATWDDFWLNEGFTVYFERRIMEEIEGKDYAAMLAKLGYEDLQATIKDFIDNQQSEDTHLKLNLSGRNPDDGVSDIAYEKGYLFLCEIEKAVGRQKFDLFLKNYFSKYAFTSITTEAFISHLDSAFVKEDKTALSTIPFKSWLYEAGLPVGFAPIQSSRFEAVEKLSKEYLDGKELDQNQIGNWSSHEWQYFLRTVSPKLSAAKMTELDKKFKLSASGNSEILCLWFTAAARLNYKAAFEPMKAFLMHVGRRKLIKPIYEALYNNPNTKDLAVQWYQEARPNYHSVSTTTLDELMKP